MKMSQRSTASAALVLIMGTACFGQHYTRINLVSNTPGAARVTDPQLMNPWGISRSPGSAWWVSDQRTGFSTVYDGAGEKQSLACWPMRELGLVMGHSLNNVNRAFHFIDQPGKRTKTSETGYRKARRSESVLTRQRSVGVLNWGVDYCRWSPENR